MLAWLLLRAYKVFEWFGTNFYIWVNRIKNFWSHLQSYANKAYGWAKDWAFPLILSYWLNAVNRIATAKNAVMQWINHQILVVRNFITIEVIKVKNLLGIETIKLSWEDQRLAVKIVSEDNKIVSFLKSWVSNFVDKLMGPFNWIIDFKEFIADLNELFTEDNKNKFIYLLGEGFSFLLNLITRPLHIILAVIEPIFLEFVTYLLAYALAGEKYELPAFPDWIGGSGGAEITGFDPPGDAKRNLGKPLNKLYISGYIFRVGHKALDLGLQMGDPVFAMHPGVVEYINKSFSGYGFQVIISGPPWWTRYAHLQRLSVSKGDRVSKGQVIGLGDDTGNSTGPHLHLEIKYNGQFVDPENILF